MARDALDSVDVENNFDFYSRRLPPMQTSVGNGGVVDIALKLVHSLLFISGAFIDVFRKQVKSVLADQSKESKVNAQTPATILHEACLQCRMSNVSDGSSERLFPNAVDIYDHLHIFQNALKSAVESMILWESFLDCLHSCIAVFGDRGHILRFKNVCAMPAWASKKLKRWKLRVFRWRWEGLEIILLDLFDAFDLFEFFDLAKMMGKSKGANALYEAISADYTDPFFSGRAGILLSLTRRVGHWMRWCEGCWCHEHILVSATSWDERHELLEKAGVPGGGPCRPWPLPSVRVYQCADCRSPVCRFFVLQTKTLCQFVVVLFFCFLMHGERIVRPRP